MAQVVQAPGDNRDNSQAGDIQIVPKELFWDWAVAAVTKFNFGITLIGFVLQYFTENTVICKASSDFNYDQISYVDTYCHGNYESGQYLFVVACGLLVVAPHYLWSSVFGGHVEYFFALVRKIRLLETGHHDPKTMDVVNMMEHQFPANQGQIFKMYKTKLVFQLTIVVSALAVNHFAFGGLTAYYKCSKEAEACMEDLRAELEGAWPPTCSLGCLTVPSWASSILKTADTVIMYLELVMLLCGLGWCLIRHPAELGAQRIATFACASGLPPGDHTFPWGEQTSKGHPKRAQKLLSPAITNDMDFLTVRLFQADHKHGGVLKEWQVYRTQRTLLSCDYEQLYRYKYTWRFKENSVIERRLQDSLLREFKIDSKGQNIEKIEDYFLLPGFKGNNIDKVFQDAFTPPDDLAPKAPITPSIYHYLYGFIHYAAGVLALEISFGAPGYTMPLTRVFQSVISVRFDTSYKGEIVPERLPGGITTVVLPLQTDLQQLQMKKFFEGHKVNFIIVGPIDKQSNHTIANNMLRKLHNEDVISAEAILLYARPLKVGNKVTEDRYLRYEPFIEPSIETGSLYFTSSFHNETVQKKLHKVFHEKSQFDTVNNYEGLRVQCDETECVFEFRTYKYTDALPSNISEVTLGKSDYEDVVKEVEPVAPRWRELGVSLGLKGPELDNIAARHSDDPRACLRATVETWLSKPEGTIKSWKHLCKALGEKAGGDNHELAQKVACRHLRWDSAEERAEKTDEGESSRKVEVTPPDGGRDQTWKMWATQGARLYYVGAVLTAVGAGLLYLYLWGAFYPAPLPAWNNQTYDTAYPNTWFLEDAVVKTVTSEGGNLSWNGYGVSIVIPQGAIPEGQIANISVRPSVKGSFVIPDGYQFASPVYLVKSSPVSFRSPVTLYLQHFLKLNDAKEFVFMSVSAHPSQLEYHFEILKQDVECLNETNSCFTNLLHFSFVAGATESRNVSKRYAVRFSRDLPKLVRFWATLSQEFCIKTMEKRIMEKSNDLDPVEYDNLEIVSDDQAIEVNSSSTCVTAERSSKAKAHELDFSCDPTSANIMFKLQLYVQLCPTRMTFVIIKAYGFNDDVVMNVIITKSQDENLATGFQTIEPTCDDSRVMTETLSKLDTELTEVTTWRELGQNLKVPEHELVNIESDDRLKNMKARKRAMLMWWLNNDEHLTWAYVSNALEMSSYSNLAKSLYNKYCDNSPEMCDLSIKCPSGQ